MDEEDLKEIDTLILKIKVAEEKRKFDIHLAYMSLIMCGILECIQKLKNGYRLTHKERMMILLMLGHFLKFDGAPATLNHICDTMSSHIGVKQLEAPVHDVTNHVA